VCGSSIAERIWTTIGIERKNNPKLQYDNKKDFIKNNAVELERPPYFRRMEKWNMEGPPLLKSLPVPTPLSPGHFAHSSEEGTVVDTRMELGFGAAHVPESISLWSEGLPGLAGWFLEYEKPIYLVQSENDPMETVSALIRLGYDNIQGYLSGGMLSWHMSGRKSDTVETLTVHEFCGILDKGQKPWILDVRSAEELEEDGKIPGAHHIHITQLPEKIRDVPLDKKVCIFCGSGLRSMTAASILKKEGIENPAVILGGLMGWDSATCPIEL
jgi:hydroxyacylglutathione hydrolase